MTATPSDYENTSLCLWKEARGEGIAGMTAVGCVIRNRVVKHGLSYHDVVYAREQFTSMSVPSDPEYNLEPSGPVWPEAESIASGVIDGTTADVTGGATLYWNPAGIESTHTFKLPSGQVVKFPATWNPAVVRFSTQIGHHIFLVEV